MEALPYFAEIILFVPTFIVLFDLITNGRRGGGLGRMMILILQKLNRSMVLKRRQRLNRNKALNLKLK